MIQPYTREAGGTTNLYKTAYAYSWPTYGKQVIRTEQTYSGGWNDDNKVTYKWDSRGYQEYEEREDWDTMLFPPAWASRYDVTQEYDKNGHAYHAFSGGKPRFLEAMCCD